MMTEMPETTHARIRLGAIVGQDHRFWKWGRDDTVYEVHPFTDSHAKAIAPGRGGQPYGNGALYVRLEDLVMGLKRTEPRRLLDEAMTEEELLRNVLELARRLGWLAYHVRDGRRSEPGLPDLVLGRRGVVILAELKTMKGKVSNLHKITKGGRVMPSQMEWIQESGAQLWRPCHWSSGEIERALT